ncbi:MAG: DUF5361 domain-containing protein [Nocardioides sp.]|uniref:DUF5361 domain-containing protein n=1 Tax=Nocardioides sp. TaxID=35761 RepID=UPI0039E273F3
MLARLLSEHRGPLAADLRRYYNLTLAHLADYGIPAREIADYVAHLPYDAATRRALDDDWWITPEIAFQRLIELDLRVLAWQRTEDGQKGRNPPKPLAITQAERTAERKKRADNWVDFDVVPIEQMAKALNWPLPKIA